MCQPKTPTNIFKQDNFRGTCSPFPTPLIGDRSWSRIRKCKMISLFDVSAVGCANPSGLPQGVWLRRDGDHAILRCNTTGDIWRITCSGSEWRGQTRVNCSQSASSSSAAAFPLDAMGGWDLTQFFAHEAFPLSKTFTLPQ